MRWVDERDASPGAEHERALVSDRRPHHAARGLCGQPTHPKADRGSLRWIKTVAGQKPTKFRGRERVGWAFTFAAAAYNLTRLPKLMAAA